MPEFYTWAILLINQQDEIGEKQLSFFGSRGGQNSTLMHVPLLIKDQESIKSSTNLTQDTTWESNKNTIKHNKQESQEVTHFQAGDQKAMMNRQENMTNAKHK